MNKKAKIIAASYITAALAMLGGYALVTANRLGDYRVMAQYSSSLAFEEAAGAISDLSETLSKSRYATDGSMCSRLCSRAYADSLAAEAAMATLPFSTHELEKLTAFIGLAGDYTCSLCASAAEEGLTEEERQSLADMAASAAVYAAAIAEYRQNLNDGVIVMDEREERAANVGTEERAALSVSLLELEEQVEELALPEYEGRYCEAPVQKAELVPEGRARAAAARFLGMDEDMLSCSYETADGLRCYTNNGMYVTLNGETVTGAASSRLVSDGRMSLAEAEKIAADFLAQQGIEAVELLDSASNGYVASMSFAPVVWDARCIDEAYSVSIALDNGKLYAYSAPEQYGLDGELEWTLSEEDAAETLPPSLTLDGISRVVRLTQAGRHRPCYELVCSSDTDERVTVYVDASNGEQVDIKIGKISD